VKCPASFASVNCRVKRKARGGRMGLRKERTGKRSALVAGAIGYWTLLPASLLFLARRIDTLLSLPSVSGAVGLGIGIPRLLSAGRRAPARLPSAGAARAGRTVCRIPPSSLPQLHDLSDRPRPSRPFNRRAGYRHPGIHPHLDRLCPPSRGAGHRAPLRGLLRGVQGRGTVLLSVPPGDPRARGRS